MKWHYTTIHFGALTELGLSALEYIISDLMYHQTKAGTQWYAYSPSEVGDLLGLNEKTIRDAVDRCVEKGTINKDGKQVITCQKFIDVVYPASGRNYRDGGRNTRQATEETSAYYNNIYKKEVRADARIVEITLSSEDSDEKRPRVSGDKRKAYDELIAWSERERGFPFLKTARLKQYAAFKIAGENGIPHKALVERWEEMSTDKFWQEKGYDWMNVVTSFNTKPV